VARRAPAAIAIVLRQSAQRDVRVCPRSPGLPATQSKPCGQLCGRRERELANPLRRRGLDGWPQRRQGVLFMFTPKACDVPRDLPQITHSVTPPSWRTTWLHRVMGWRSPGPRGVARRALANASPHWWPQAQVCMPGCPSSRSQKHVHLLCGPCVTVFAPQSSGRSLMGWPRLAGSANARGILRSDRGRRPAASIGGRRCAGRASERRSWGGAPPALGGGPERHS
jgi:hypothetical protein